MGASAGDIRWSRAVDIGGACTRDSFAAAESSSQVTLHLVIVEVSDCQAAAAIGTNSLRLRSPSAVARSSMA